LANDYSNHRRGREGTGGIVKRKSSKGLNIEDHQHFRNEHRWRRVKRDGDEEDKS
jgi:hypothetical protein